jgi:hypothetical protein
LSVSELTFLQISARRRPDASEAMIERIEPRGDCVEISLLLDDGSSVATTLGEHEASWLELAAGDIVFVHHYRT